MKIVRWNSGVAARTRQSRPQAFAPYLRDAFADIVGAQAEPPVEVAA